MKAKDYRVYKKKVGAHKDGTDKYGYKAGDTLFKDRKDAYAHSDSLKKDAEYKRFDKTVSLIDKYETKIGDLTREEGEEDDRTVEEKQMHGMMQDRVSFLYKQIGVLEQPKAGDKLDPSKIESDDGEGWLTSRKGQERHIVRKDVATDVNTRFKDSKIKTHREFLEKNPAEDGTVFLTINKYIEHLTDKKIGGIVGVKSKSTEELLKDIE